MVRSGEDGSGGDGDKPEDAGSRASGHADQHGQPGFEVPESRTMDRRGEDGSGGDGDKSDGAREEHPSTLTSMANLASTYWNQGRWSDAKKIFVQVMETRRRVLGEEHPDTLTSMANLASTYCNQGRWAEAEKMDTEVKETMRRVLGEEHPSTLTSMANLASTYRNQGRWSEAKKMEVEVTDGYRRLSKRRLAGGKAIRRLSIEYVWSSLRSRGCGPSCG
jgi:putative hemolysin